MFLNSLHLRLVCSALALILLVGPACASRGDVLLRRELAATARQIKGILDKEPVARRSVTIAGFRCRGDTYATNSGGQHLTRFLSEELEKLAVVLKPRGVFEVSGTFRMVQGKDSLVQAKIFVNLEDDQGNKTISEMSFMEPEVVTFLFPSHPQIKQDGTLETLTTLQMVDVRDDRIRASKDGRFSIEVLVADPDSKLLIEDYRPAKPTVTDGLPFVKLQYNQCYAIRLTNEADHDVCVALYIDGLNVFHFAKKPAPAYVLVNAKKSTLIRGWFQHGKTYPFLVTDRDLGAWKMEGISPASVGCIKAQFRACWKEGDDPPKDEPKAQIVKREAEYSTGKGNPIEGTFRVVSRKLGIMRDSITVFYNRPGK